MTDEAEIVELQGAMLKLHGAKSEHVESVPVRETFQGQVVWDGVVEVFDLTGTPLLAGSTPGHMRLTAAGGASLPCSTPRP